MQRKANVIHGFLVLPVPTAGSVNYVTTAFQRWNCHDSRKQHEKEEKKNKRISSRCKMRECCKRRVFCSSAGFEGAALFGAMGANFPAVSSEVAHCRAVILYLNKHNAVN